MIGLMLVTLSVLPPLEMLVAAPPPAPQIKVVSIRASSTMPKWKGYSFGAENLIDGRVDTSWQPAKSDALGVGQWVDIDLGARYDIDHIDIAAFQKVDPKLGDLYCRNNRFESGVILFDDGSAAPLWNMANETNLTTSVFRRHDMDIDPNVAASTRTLRLVIWNVWEPVDWSDLAIGEISVYGTPAAVEPSLGATVSCDGFGSLPLKQAIGNLCATGHAERMRLDCPGIARAMAECRTLDHAKFAPLPTVAASDLEAGKVVWQWRIERVQHRFELAGGRGKPWKVARHSRLDAAAKPAPPVLTLETQYDRNGQNECYEKLGKTRPEDPDGDQKSPGGGDVDEAPR